MCGQSRPKPKKYEPSQQYLRDLAATQNETNRLMQQSKRYEWQAKDDDLYNKIEAQQKALQSAEDRQKQVEAMGGHGYYKQNEIGADISTAEANRAANPWEWNFGTTTSGKIAGYNLKGNSEFTAAENAKNQTMIDYFNNLVNERKVAKDQELLAQQNQFKMGQDTAKAFAATGAGVDTNKAEGPIYTMQGNKPVPRMTNRGMIYKAKKPALYQSNMLDSENPVGLTNLQSNQL